MNPYVEILYPPTPPTLGFCADVECKHVGCHVNFFTEPPSSCFFYPLDCTIFCSSIPNSICDVHKDQVADGVGVEKLTYAIIFYEYVRKS